MPQGSVVVIYVTAVKGEPMRAVKSVRAVEGRGLEGDRYFDHGGTWSVKPGSDCEVTLIESEAVEAVERDCDVALQASQSRRNIVTLGVPLNHLVGREFEVGEAVLHGMTLCEPCGYLEKKTRDGVKQALLHRGGLRARIVKGGVISTGCQITYPSSQSSR